MSMTEENRPRKEKWIVNVISANRATIPQPILDYFDAESGDSLVLKVIGNGKCELYKLDMESV